MVPVVLTDLSRGDKLFPSPTLVFKCVAAEDMEAALLPSAVKTSQQLSEQLQYSLSSVLKQQDSHLVTAQIPTGHRQTQAKTGSLFWH